MRVPYDLCGLYPQTSKFLVEDEGSNIVVFRGFLEKRSKVVFKKSLRKEQKIEVF